MRKNTPQIAGVKSTADGPGIEGAASAGAGEGSGAAGAAGDGNLGCERRAASIRSRTPDVFSKSASSAAVYSLNKGSGAGCGGGDPQLQDQ